MARDSHSRYCTKGTPYAPVEGRLIENLHVEEARRVVALADAIPEAAELYQHQTI